MDAKRVERIWWREGQNYLGVHRHAAVRTELLSHPSITLRLAVAHILAGSGLWRVEAEDQRTDSAATRTSLAASKAETGFAEERARIRKTHTPPQPPRCRRKSLPTSRQARMAAPR